MDWLTPVMGIIGVVVGAGIQEFRIWREKKDKYMDMVFEKRLDAHQGAYYWCMRLLKVALPINLTQDGGVQVAVEEINEAMEWVDKNALYLDEDSRIEIGELFKFVNVTSSKYVDRRNIEGINSEEERQKVVKKVREVLSSITRGIGVKYLPEQRI